MQGTDAIAVPRTSGYRNIGQRLVVIVLLVNAVLSLIATSAQLYLAYQRDKVAVVSSVAAIEQSFRNSLETALWEFNYALVDALVDGVSSKNDVEYVEVVASDGTTWVRGVAREDADLIDELSLSYLGTSEQEVQVGTMRIELTLDNVEARVWAQFWTVLASNFAKTAMASFVLFFIFNQRVTQHLQSISNHVSTTSWMDVGTPLRLHRGDNGTTDDIDLIVSAINAAKRRSLDDFQALRIETAQRRATEEDLRQKAASLEAANREQAEFTYAISHDLKSPSNTIRMLLDEIVLEDGSVMSANGKEMISAARDTNIRMARLIDDLLAYARTVDDVIDTQDVIPQSLIMQIIEDLHSDIKEVDGTVECGHIPTIRASEVQMRLLFQNLIANGLKFRDATRAPVIEIGSTMSPDDGEVTIWIRDNGIGIEPEHHERIFGMFKRLHPHDVYVGSGLGLAICQRVVNNHGGTLRVTSVPGEGTVFWVTLPGA